MFELGKVKSIIKWPLYLISGLFAILVIIKGGTIHQYESKATNFKRKEIPVIHRPVVTICPKLNSSYKYGIDFNISIGSSIAKLGTITAHCDAAFVACTHTSVAGPTTYQARCLPPAHLSCYCIQ